MTENTLRILLERGAPQNLEEWCFQTIAASFASDTSYEELHNVWHGVLAYIDWLNQRPVKGE
jgi:hypothetical protein